MRAALPSARRLAAAVALVLAAVAAPVRADVKIQARLEPEEIPADGTAVLTIEVQGDSFGRFTFRPAFELDNLEEVGGPYRSDSITFVNGEFSRTLRVSWQLRPLGPGRAGVRMLRIHLRGQVLDLGEREIEVVPAGRGGPYGSGGPPGHAAGGQESEDQEEDEPDPFDRFFGPSPLRRLLDPFERRREPRVLLRAELAPERPWVGQQVLYTVYLYTREDISAISPREIPTFRGFWVRDVPQPQNLPPPEMVEIDGERYGRVPLLRKALFALRPGAHRIEPTEMDVVVRTIETSFFGPRIERPRQVDLKTAPLAVDVRPLPPAPPGFAGAVGRLSLSTELVPRQIAIGEAATLTVTLAGQGHVQGLPAPRIAEPAGLELLPPEQGGGDELAGGTLRGNQTWSYAVVPERPGRYRLAVPAIPYFDPAAGEYRVATASPVELVAAPRMAEGGLPGQPHPVRSAAFALSRPLGPYLGRMSWRGLAPWLFALPLGIAAALALVRARRPESAGAGAPRGAAAGGRAARHRVEARLREVAGEARPRLAAAGIEEAWREFLHERWNVAPGTPSPQWGKLLAARGADQEAAAELVALADDLHYLRYAPQLSATGPMIAEVLARCHRLLRRLR